MNPDEVRMHLMEMVARVTGRGDGLDPELMSLAEQVKTLDDWLCAGGELPTAWSRCSDCGCAITHRAMRCPDCYDKLQASIYYDCYSW